MSLRVIGPGTNVTADKPLLVLGHMDTVWGVGEVGRRPGFPVGQGGTGGGGPNALTRPVFHKDIIDVMSST